jgi:outer membrane receptor for ferrienterochelin and colicins
MKRKVIRAMIVLLSLICAQILFSNELPQERPWYRQGEVNSFSIKGKVEDWEENPIKGAIVLIPEINKSVDTDASGGFKISQIPPGRYHLEVYADKFMDYISEPFDLTQDKFDFDLILIKKIYEEIVVTATQTPKLYAETPVKTEIITRTAIEKKEAANLSEALCLTTGVRVENNCQNCNFTQVRINGMEGKYTQILIDSSPVISAMTGVYGLEQIPTEMLERIEIIKGAGSALYGGNAVAGVVNVLTREPQENKAVLKLHQESIQGKSFTHLGFDSSFVSEDLNTKAFIFANYQKREPVDLNGDGFSELGTIANTSFGANFFNYFPKIKGNLKLGFSRIFEERRGGDLFDKPPHEANTAESAKTDDIGFDSKWNHYLSEKASYNISLSYMNADRESYYGSHQDPNAYGKTRNPLLFFNSQLNYQAKGHVFSLGAQYKRDKIQDEAIGYGRIIRDTYKESGFFIQDDFKISRASSLLTGLRINKHSALSKLIITPRASFLWNLTKDLTLRISASTGFRPPQVFDEDLHITQVGGQGMIIKNSPELKEEKAYSLFFGVDYGRQLARSLIQFSFETFYTRLTDTFIFHEISRIENARILERINGSGSKVYGVSSNIGLTFGPKFSFSSGWTIQRSWLDEPEPIFKSREFFRTPNSYGFASVSYENNKFISADLSLEYTGPMKAPHYAGYIKEDRLEETRSFWVVNAKLRKIVGLSESSKISLFLGAFNLLNSYQKDLDRGVDRDSGYVYGPSRPRSIYTGLQFSF